MEVSRSSPAARFYGAMLGTSRFAATFERKQRGYKTATDLILKLSTGVLYVQSVKTQAEVVERPLFIRSHHKLHFFTPLP